MIEDAAQFAGFTYMYRKDSLVKTFLSAHCPRWLIMATNIMKEIVPVAEINIISLHAGVFENKLGLKLQTDSCHPTRHNI